MKLWNYIGGFFLFRWLFGKLHRPKRENDTLTNGRSDISDEESRSPIMDDSDDIDSLHDTISAAGENYNGNYDESDDLDDLDIFMRNNNVREYGNKSHRSGYYGSHRDWSSGSYNQSFDDFHEEQDDYDMMDDF